MISRIIFYLSKLLKNIQNLSKRPANACEYMNVSLLYSNHRHNSATNVDVFRAARERIRQVAMLKMVTWVVETCRWWLFLLLNIKSFHMKKLDFHQISEDLFQTDNLSLSYMYFSKNHFSGMIQTVPPYCIHRSVISNTVGN